MDAQSREKRITEIMTEIANQLINDGPLPLKEIVENYDKTEVGLAQIAYSRLEADGLMIRDRDNKWRWNGPQINKKKPQDFEPIQIFLYNDMNSGDFDIEAVADYLRDKDFSEKVVVRGEFLQRFGEPDTARALAECEVWDPTSPETSHEIREEDIAFEKDLIEGEGEMTGLLYDGMKLMNTFFKLIPINERKENNLHIIYTKRFFGTWKPATQRYHSRISINGYPTIISTTGIVDAPARPRGLHHIEKNGDGVKISKNDDETFTGDYVEYSDPRMTEIMKGYAMQSVFHHFWNWPFCENNKCRMYSPHAQANILNAQMGQTEFCKKHRKEHNND